MRKANELRIIFCISPVTCLALLCSDPVSLASLHVSCASHAFVTPSDVAFGIARPAASH